MKKKYSYHDCYHVLDTKPNSSWSELRSAYKKSIQKWHPDKFKEGSPEKLAAEHKIKAINIAYNQIHQYYRDNASLPPIEEPSDKAEKVKPVETVKKPAETKKSASSDIPKKPRSRSKTANRDDRKTSYRSLLSFIALVSMYPAYYLFIDNSKVESQYIHDDRSTEDNSQNIATPLIINEHTSNARYLPDKISQKTQNKIKSTDRKSTQKHSLAHDDYFTNGSTFSDVIGAQGAPTRTDGNTWFYGQSEIHFIDGKVSHWVRTAETPLKAQITIK